MGSISVRLNLGYGDIAKVLLPINIVCVKMREEIAVN